MLNFMKVLMGLFLLMPTVHFAQTNIETFSQLQFNFNNPGARAAGIGGAFISIADDATAAEANPAGLTALIQPEISAELKAVRYSRTIFNFDAMGTENNFEYVERDFENSVVSPSFVSVVYPFKNFTVSVFRHELVNFESSFETRQTFIEGFPGFVFFALDSNLDMLVANWGGSVGYKINSQFSIGASAGSSRIKVTSRLLRFATNGSGSIRFRYNINDNDKDMFFNLGLIYKPTAKISIGAILKTRPKFRIAQNIEDLEDNSSFSNNINFKIPSTYGIGISYRPNDFFTLALDVVRNQYSDLTDGFVLTDATQAVQAQEFQADDATEIHLGGEYVHFVNDLGIVFRGGVFTEPDHSIQFVGSSGGNLNREANRLAFQKGESDFHIALGVGLITQGNFQVDAAADLSKRNKQAVGSFVYRFNK